jgi:hypothetical protein
VVTDSESAVLKGAPTKGEPRSGPQQGDGGKPLKDDVPSGVDYARRLYDNVLSWYHNADSKAQVILGLDGAFLAFLTASAFQKPEDVGVLLAALLLETRVLLGLMALTLILSIGAAILCIWSRLILDPKGAVAEILKQKGETADRYPPEVMWYFQHIAKVPQPALLRTLRGVDDSFEVEALSAQVSILSGIVQKKHMFVNAGFVLAGMTLVLFVVAAWSYVSRVGG